MNLQRNKIGLSAGQGEVERFIRQRSSFYSQPDYRAKFEEFLREHIRLHPEDTNSVCRGRWDKEASDYADGASTNDNGGVFASRR
jgi:hypothetical protein